MDLLPININVILSKRLVHITLVQQADILMRIWMYTSKLFPWHRVQNIVY